MSTRRKQVKTKRAASISERRTRSAPSAPPSPFGKLGSQPFLNMDLKVAQSEADLVDYARTREIRTRAPGLWETVSVGKAVVRAYGHEQFTRADVVALHETLSQ